MTKPKEYLVGLREYADAYNVSLQALRQHINRGRFNSAQKDKKGYYWLIDINEPYPDYRLKKGEEQNIMQKVVNTYQKLESLSDTAKAHNLSVLKTRRILLTEGVYSSEFSEKVRGLSEQGFTTREIQEKLGVSKQVVGAYMPYKSNNAKKPK